jgi:hypothetical protein
VEAIETLTREDKWVLPKELRERAHISAGTSWRYQAVNAMAIFAASPCSKSKNSLQP